MTPGSPLGTSVMHCAVMYVKGVLAALSLHRVAGYARRSKRLVTLATRCIVVNGVVFIGSLTVLDYLLAPVVGWVLDRWSTADAGVGTGFDDPPVDEAMGGTSAGKKATTAGFLWTMRALWLYPTYFASTVINSFTAGEIARISCGLAREDGAKRSRGKGEVDGDADTKKKKTKGGLAGFAESVYHVLIVNSLFAQITVLSFVFTNLPGRIATRALQTWLYAFYCHDYLWSAESRTPKWRLAHFEGNWAYYAGFGSPIVLISALNLSSFYASAAMAMAFPVFMIAAIAGGAAGAESTNGEGGWTRQGRFPVFHLASETASSVLRLVGIGAGGGRAVKTKRE